MREYFRSLRHELRTPLNYIVGYSELLLDAADDTGQHHLIPGLQKICRASKEPVALVDPATGDVDTMDLGRLCHELRTPLNAIIGYSELEAAA